MDADISELELHPACRGAARPRPSPALIELTAQHGVLQPVLVRPLGGRRYEILAHGEVWLAAQLAGLYRVPVEVLADTDDDAAREIIAATAHRPPPLDLARRYGRLVEQERARGTRGAVARVARACGVPRSHVARAIRVLALPAALLEAVDRGALSFGHAYALLACPGNARRETLGREAITGKLSVRALERRVRASTGAASPSTPTAATVALPAPRSPDAVRLERHIAEQIGTPVTLDEHGGTLTIDYRGSLDVLEGVLERLRVDTA